MNSEKHEHLKKKKKKITTTTTINNNTNTNNKLVLYKQGRFIYMAHLTHKVTQCASHC